MRSHPVALAVQRLTAAVQGAASATGAAEELEAEAEACQELLQILRSPDKEARAEAVTGADYCLKIAAVWKILLH